MIIVDVEKLKKEIYQQGLSLSKFAHKCNKSKSSMYNVIKRKSISAQYATTICDKLQQDFDYFFTVD